MGRERAERLRALRFPEQTLVLEAFPRKGKAG